MVFAACFKPGRVTPVHDHGTWAVVAGVDGEEKNTIICAPTTAPNRTMPRFNTEATKWSPRRCHRYAKWHVPHRVERKRRGLGVAAYLRHEHQPCGALQIDPDTGKIEESKYRCAKVAASMFSHDFVIPGRDSEPGMTLRFATRQ